MFYRRLSWRLFAALLTVLLTVLAVATWHSAASFRAFYLHQASETLQTRASLISERFAHEVAADNRPAVDSLCKAIGRAVSTRITVVLPSGVVIGDSDNDPAAMENHGDRPEIHAVLSGQSHGEGRRFSTTMWRQMLYAASPLYDGGGRLVAVLRLSFSIESLRQMLNRYYARIIAASMVMALLAAVLSWWVSRKMSRPLEVMKEGAMKFASGDLTHSIPVLDGGEMGQLARALNRMAGQLDERIRTITRQSNEQKAILSSMTEGVLALDAGKRVLMINRAAKVMLGIETADLEGKWIHELVRNSALDKFIDRAVSAAEPIEGEIVVPKGDGDLHLQIHGTALQDMGRAPFGVLLVFNDITAIRRLENIRKDFVDNASHELRTPLTAVKGFVETLLSGAYSGEEELKRFLGIISSKVDRLCTIVDDLLTLSSIEKETDRDEIAFEESPVDAMIAAAVDACRRRAAARSIELQSACEKELVVRMNPSLMEQAMINLLDNAIKYSDEGTVVTVEAQRHKDETVISVRDQGIGIEKEHLDRIFERFYRVDKARSRKLGGSGLGLSIVKNIAAAHGGRVSVESSPGKGSTFRIHLPACRTAGAGSTTAYTPPAPGGNI